MPNDENSPGRIFGPLAVGALAAVIVVRGTVSIVPDAILRDSYGDIRGIFLLVFCLLGIAVFAAAGKAFEQFKGWNTPEKVDHSDERLK